MNVAGERRTIVREPAVLLLGLVAAAAAIGLPVLSVAPNRLARGVAVTLADLHPVLVVAIALPIAGLIVAALLFDARARYALAILSAALLVASSLAMAGVEAAHLADPTHPAQRVALGGAFWLLAASAALVLATLARRRTARRWVFCAAAVTGAALVVAAARGLFADLSLAREFDSHRNLFGDALLRHIALVAAALVATLAVGIPLTLAIGRRAKLRRAVFQALSLLQTIPSIALFGLLIAPLSALAAAHPVLERWGLGGTGMAPALIALVLYALLPLVRSFNAGFSQVPPAVLDAARGLGFTRRQRFWRLALPLALPALLSGLRVVAVQTIGLTAVAALIGAGGLGTFIFQGIGQYALDLVLVGALPIVGLALTTDAAFAALIDRLRHPA